jgi:hypothetical protein
VVVVTGRVESGGDLESDGDIECFGMKSEMTWGRLLFIGSKISAHFWFKTTTDIFGICTEVVLVSNCC